MIDNLESIYAQDRRSGNLHGSPVSGGGPGRFLFQEVIMEDGLCKCGCGNKTRIAYKTSKQHGWIKGKHISYLNGHRHIKENHWNWKGGKTTIEGYPAVSIEKDNKRRHKNGYVLEHLLIAEKALGKPILQPHEIHHFNGNRKDNRNANIVVCEDRKYHLLIHARQRAMAACGDPNSRKCCFCKEYDSLERLITFVRACGRERYYHRECRNENSRKRSALSRAEGHARVTQGAVLPGGGLPGGGCGDSDD